MIVARKCSALTRKKSGQRLSKSQDADVRKRLALGQTVNSIASELGVSRGTVERRKFGSEASQRISGGTDKEMVIAAARDARARRGLVNVEDIPEPEEEECPIDLLHLTLAERGRRKRLPFIRVVEVREQSTLAEDAMAYTVRLETNGTLTIDVLDHIFQDANKWRETQ